MPIFQFKCENGHEFEKLVWTPSGHFKWCKHCNALTEWVEIRERDSDLYREKVCTQCMGNDDITPMLSNSNPGIPDSVQTDCPECNAKAVRILRIEPRGSHSGGPNIADSSVRFHFNYPEPTD